GPRCGCACLPAHGDAVRIAAQTRGRGELGGADRGGLEALALTPEDVALHGVVFGQAEPIHARCGRGVALLDALPELSVIVAREGRAVLLALVLEDREDLEAQLVLRERHQDVRLADRPLLPGTAVVPDVGRV